MTLKRQMTNLIKLKKGYDIKLVGEAAKEFAQNEASRTYVVKPSEFFGITPKLLVEVGSEVKCGTPLFFAKGQPEMMFTSPVSGEVVEINRGEKRAILEIKILADGKMQHETFPSGDPASLGRETVKAQMLKSGAWTLLRQRPFNRLADVFVSPKNIFVSGFDSSPLAPDLNFALKGRESHLQAGINALAALTDGKVFLGLKHGADNSTFQSLKNVVINHFDGPHPAGNVGIQIHHTAPINKGDHVWTVNAQDLATIGKLFTEGIFDPERVIAITGSEVKVPKYAKVRQGANVDYLLKDNLSEGKNRVISGSVLFGTTISENGYLGYYDQQISVIPEGEDPEMFGWLIPTYPRPSISKTFLSYLMPNKKFKVNTNMHGEERAYVVTNEYEKVLPMDILPVHLIKACLANDLEAMEALGIFEVVEEDLALCEFVCTSKAPVQEILAEGLALIEKEG